MSLDTAGDQPVRYFIRDDDVGALTDDLRRFVDAFVSRGIAVSYQIIPAQFTAECADYLLAVERDHPSLIEFGQHGLRHEMWLGGKRLKREFGPERSLADQTADIAEGQAILTRLLGRPVSLFTPPQHKFDRNTIAAVVGAGHRLFSAAYYATPHHHLAYALGRGLGLSSIRHHGISYHGRRRPEGDIQELSISVAVDNGKGVTTSAKALPGALRKAAVRSAGMVGLMFHHKVYQTVAGQAELEAIADQLAAYPPQAFHRIADLAPAA